MPESLTHLLQSPLLAKLVTAVFAVAIVAVVAQLLRSLVNRTITHADRRYHTRKAVTLAGYGIGALGARRGSERQPRGIRHLDWDRGSCGGLLPARGGCERLEDAQVQPAVTTSFAANWMTFTLRHVVDYQKRRFTKDRLFTRILEGIAASDGRVRLASSTMRRLPLSAFAVAAAIAVGQPGALTAQDVLRPDTTATGTAVIVRGDTLFHIRTRLGPFTPSERAAAVSRRVDSLIANPLSRTQQVTVVDSTGVSEVRAGDFVIVTVTAADAMAAGVDRRQLAEQWAAAARTAIASHGGEADLRSILFGSLFTLLTAAGLVVLLWGMGRFFPWLYRTLDSWRGSVIPAIKIQRLEVLSADRLTDALIVAARGLRVVAVVIALYVFLPLVFSFFPWTRGLSDILFGWVLNPLQQAGRSFVAYLPDLFSVAVIIAVTYFLLKFIRLFFVGLGRGAITLPGFYRDWAEPTYKIVRFLVIVFVAVMIYPYLPGSDTAAFKGISVFLGILVSFGSASAIANVIAGVVMTYMRPFQIGDRVRISDTVGDVIEKTLLVTRVRTPKQVDTTIPNAMVLSSHIINYSRTAKQGGVILHTTVTIGYDAPWRTVHALLLAAAEATENVLDDPKPFVLQNALNDFTVSYELNVFTDDPNEMQTIYSDLHQHIQDKFNEGGIEIMSPHYAALRDGNMVAVPSEYRGKHGAPGAFHVRRET